MPEPKYLPNKVEWRRGVRPRCGGRSSVGRASGCGPECRGFEPHRSPHKTNRSVSTCSKPELEPPLLFFVIFKPMPLIKTLVFSFGWIGIIYIANCLIAQRLISIAFRKLGLYTLTMAALGLFGELVFDTVYKLVCGEPLWIYEVFPIHNNYTSLYSLFLWGAMGLHLYLLHETLAHRCITALHVLATFFCGEAILLEALVNLSHLAMFGTYIFYYLPGDLWHVTSFRAFPLYLLAGFITVVCMHFSLKLPRWSILGNSSVLCLLLTIK